MKGSVLITIIVPSYNSEIGIRRCLQSINDQKFNDYEVLIIEGLSNDNTLNIIKPFSEKNGRIHVISEKDKGIYDAMNKGISLARGIWLFFLGSDDALTDALVLEQVSEKLEGTDAEFVYGDVQIVGGDTSWVKDGSIFDGEFNREKLFSINICQQAIFYKRTLFNKIGNFNIAYTTCADWDLNHRCFASVKTLYLPLTIALFSAGGESTRNEKDRFVTKDIVLNLRKYYHLNYWSPLFANFAWPFWNLSMEYLENKKYPKSVAFFLYAFFHGRNKISLVKKYLLIFFRSFQNR